MFAGRRPRLLKQRFHKSLIEIYAVLSLRRNREVVVEPLQILADARSNPEIAVALCLSTRTVERHVQNIMNKLHVHNRTAAANWAIRNGLA